MTPDEQVARIRREQSVQAPQADALLRLVGDEANPAVDQAAEAITRTQQSFHLAPQMPWRVLHDLVGPVLPDALWIIGAQTGHGKTTLMLNWLQTLARSAGQKTYVLPLEQRPAMMRLVWASLSLGYPTALVLENRWRELPDDAEKQVQAHVAEQVEWCGESVVFSDVEYLSEANLEETFQDAHAQGCTLILVDHLHRMAESSYRAMAMVAKALTRNIRKYGIPVACTAQFNQGGPERNPLQGYREPQLSDIYMGQVIAHEAHVILGLYRPLQGMSKEETQAVKNRETKAWKFAIPNTVGVHCMKHRVRGMLAEGRSIELQYDRGRITV
jgi:replicative DNA helicase